MVLGALMYLSVGVLGGLGLVGRNNVEKPKTVMAILDLNAISALI